MEAMGVEPMSVLYPTTSNYMLSLFLYSFIIPETGFNKRGAVRDTSQATHYAKPHLSVLSC